MKLRVSAIICLPVNQRQMALQFWHWRYVSVRFQHCTKNTIYWLKIASPPLYETKRKAFYRTLSKTIYIQLLSLDGDSSDHETLYAIDRWVSHKMSFLSVRGQTCIYNNKDIVHKRINLSQTIFSNMKYSSPSNKTPLNTRRNRTYVRRIPLGI